MAWWRRMQLPAEERFTIQFRVTLPDLGERPRDKVITTALMAGVIVAIGILGYVISVSGAGETFTDFYILDQNGQAADYPQNLVAGEEGAVIIGIVNHEGREFSYRVEVVIDGNKYKEIGPIVLTDEQRWQEEVDFLPGPAAEKQKVEFILYVDGESDSYLDPLYLWVEVKE
jgi:uncharacterized membrane protein